MENKNAIAFSKDYVDRIIKERDLWRNEALIGRELIFEYINPITIEDEFEVYEEAVKSTRMAGLR